LLISVLRAIFSDLQVHWYITCRCAQTFRHIW